MYIILNEIKDQFFALEKTVKKVKEMEAPLTEQFMGAKKTVIFGSGSSYLLAKSMAAQLMQLAGIPSYPVPAGDFLVQPEDYAKAVRGALVVTISRSGSTSEIIMAVKKAKEMGALGCVSYCAVEKAEISALSDLDVELPWCFDASVCQTRTVTNLYAALLLTAALCVKEKKIISSLERAPKLFEKYCGTYDTVFEDIGRYAWNHAVVLADSSVAGLAEEGALAFKEICQMNSNFYHVLDVRHGPMVMVNKDTLVIVFAAGQNKKLLQELIKDIQKKGALCVVFDCGMDREVGEEICINLPKELDSRAAALFMMYGIQRLTYEKAMRRRVNPDAPDGLDAWIKLEEVL
ncbi:MAG: SIS domain-containing protein [Eubacteriales bacterium]|nr:SIS domain-containing protein [Eubacteriales bacterium]